MREQDAKTLGIGIIGGGFIARFHIKSWVGVRDADILGVFDPDAKRAREACALVRSLGVRRSQALRLDHGHGRRSGASAPSGSAPRTTPGARSWRRSPRPSSAAGPSSSA